MPAAHQVPRLKEKLELLFQHSVGLNSALSFGRIFRSDGKPNGISSTAIQKWISANRVPAERYEQFVEMFRVRLPGGPSRKDTIAYLAEQSEAPLRDAFLSAAPEHNWVNMLTTARPARVELIQQSNGTFGIAVLASRTPASGQIRWPIGRGFQMKVSVRKFGWLTTFQGSEAGWYGTATARQSISIETSDHTVTLPHHDHLIVHEPCECKYLFLETSTPLPMELSSKIGSSAEIPAVLDIGTLDRIATFLTNVERVQLSVADIKFVRNRDSY